MRIKYRDYVICHDPPPIPSRAFDWKFYHEGFDGSPDSRDRRCGSGPDTEDCQKQIDEIEDELNTFDSASSML